jgi:hypothetical protein
MASTGKLYTPRYLGDEAYKRLARFRLFWRIALQRYRQSLEKTYCELKIPFRQSRPLQMQDVYVPLRVDGGDKKQVDAYQTIQNKKRLVVLGDPGSGKTMLLRHVAFTYARQRLDDFQDQPIPVFLELNRVESAGNSLLVALTKALENHNFPKAERFLISKLENQSLLILLDGLDEVNAQARHALVNQIKDLDQKYRGNRIIVTCRKAVYQSDYLDAWVDQKLEIIEFSDQQLQRFMTSWQKDMPAEKSIEHFFRTLQERPQIMALARNPLLLTMVAYLYVDTEFALPHSHSEFYSRSTDLLLDQWHGKRNYYEAKYKRAVLQRLAWFNQTKTGNSRERRTMEWTEVLDEIRAILPNWTLKTEDAQPLLDEIVQRSGLLIAIDGGTRYIFTHLTLQEYFAARALEADQKKPLDFYRAAPDAWREVVRLWCALEHDSTAMLKELYTLDPVMAFECLSDAQQVDDIYADELIESFKPRLREALTNDLLRKAFALLAADLRPRGKKWFEFVNSNLNDENNRLAACTVLAKTNIPAAAEPLAKLAATESDVIPFLVQLGNLAVPALTEPVQKGEVWAMDALVDIGTPQAALVLQPLLWTDEPKAYQAAWRLAALLPLSGVEEILQTVKLNNEQRKAKQIEWVWDPFSNDATLRNIVGRTAHLLATTQEDILPEINLLWDYRLALPLCVLVLNKPRLKQNYYELLSEWVEKEFEGVVNLPALINSSQVDRSRQEKILPQFTNYIDSSVWKRAYSALSISVQFLLFQKILRKETSSLFSLSDWHNLRQLVNYDFSKSWHAIVLKFLLFILLPLNIWGMVLKISQSPTLLTWRNIGVLLLGVLLLVGTTWTQRINWKLDAMNSIFAFALLGVGGAFGIMIGGLTNNWLVGSMVGFIVSAVVVSAIVGIGSGDIANSVGSCGVVIGVVVGGGVSGGVVGNEILGGVGAVIGVIVGIILSVIVAVVIVAVISSVVSDVGIIIIGVIGGAFISSAFVESLVYFATALLYELAGLPVVILFWFIWLGTFILLCFIANHQQSLAQNPLHGLLVPSPSTNPSQAQGKFWSRISE